MGFFFPCRSSPIPGEYPRIIAQETRKGEGAVDVIRLRKEYLGYFSNQAPIYARKKKSLLSRLFG
jgi:hypothetical protein